MSKYPLLLLLLLSACPGPYSDDPGGSSSSSSQTSSWGHSSTSGPGIMTTTVDDSSSSTTGGPTDTGDTSSATGDSSITGDSSSTGESPCECVAGEPFCTASCTWETRELFVTSQTIAGDFITPDFEKITPDIFCNRSACDVDDCGYTALIMGDQLFFNLLDEFQGRYILPSGGALAEGPWDWAFGDLLRPLNEDAEGNLVTGKVWTGYDPDPEAANQFGFLCPGKMEPWSGIDSESRVGIVGASEAPFWYDSESWPCSGGAHVICVKTS